MRATDAWIVARLREFLIAGITGDSLEHARRSKDGRPRSYSGTSSYIPSLPPKSRFCRTSSSHTARG